MDNNLKQLIELQKIDSRLLQIEESKGDLPSTVESLNMQLNIAKDQEQSRKDRMSEVDSRIRKETSLIDDSNVKLEKFKEQLYLVKSNKEYDALSMEMDHLKNTIKDSEDIVINLEEEKESIEGDSKNFESEIQNFESTLKEKNSELDIAISNTKKEESELNKNRLGVVKKIESRFVSNYDRLRKTREGLGITNIFSNACGACYTQLPRQTVLELKDNASIISCPNCSIYLFFEEELD